MHDKGSYTFRMHGQNYHGIDTLIPHDKYKPKYAQLYIHDAYNEIENIMNHLQEGKAR